MPEVRRGRARWLEVLARRVRTRVENVPGSDSVEFDGNGGNIALVLAPYSVRRGRVRANVRVRGLMTIASETEPVV